MRKEVQEGRKIRSDLAGRLLPIKVPKGRFLRVALSCSCFPQGLEGGMVAETQRYTADTDSSVLSYAH